MIVYTPIFYCAELQLAFKGKITREVADTLHWSYRPFWHKYTKWHQNDLENYKAKGTPYYVLLVSPSPRYHSVSLYQPFVSYRPFWDKCTEWPKMTLNTTRSKVPLFVLLVSPNPKFTCRFPVTGHIQTAAPNAPKVSLNTTKSKVSHICVSDVPESQIAQMPKCGNFENRPIYRKALPVENK